MPSARKVETTSVKIPSSTKARIARAAKEAGITVHAYLLDVIERATAQADKRREFVQEALAARARFRRTGLAHRAEDVWKYLDAKAAGKNPPPLKPTRIR